MCECRRRNASARGYIISVLPWSQSTWVTVQFKFASIRAQSGSAAIEIFILRSGTTCGERREIDVTFQWTFLK